MSEFTVKRAKTRIDNGKIGEKIVEERLKELGWVVQNANEIMTNQPNFDLIAKKHNRLIRIQVKAKGDVWCSVCSRQTIVQ